MNWLLRLGVGLTQVVQQTTTEITTLVVTWAALAVSGANPRTWEQLATKTWQELT
jgi:hypothetical protein